jgi:hypothetical protein
MEIKITKNTVIAADLDGTLAESKLAIGSEMALAISDWLRTSRFAIISGGAYEQFQKQIIEQLPPDTNLSNLFLFPTNGAVCFRYTENMWKEVYKNTLTDEEQTKIFSSFEAVLRDSSLSDIVDEMQNHQHGDRLEYRGGQITLSALGQHASIEEKAPWDPDQSKRKRIAELLIPLLPEFYVAIAGSTSIDVTRKGIDKEYAIKNIAEILQVQEQDIIFFGDAIFEGGNDYAVTRTNATTIKVANPKDTLSQLTELIAKIS